MIAQKFQAFIERTVRILRQDPRICGIALGGSYITGQMDEYSDLDFIIAVEPDCFEQVVDEKMAIADKLGDLLSAFTGEHVGVPNLLICLYDAPLLHVDFHFRPLDRAGERVDEPAILYEKDGALTNIYRRTEITQKGLNLQWLEDRFWVWVHYIALKIARGELLEAVDAITFIRARVIGAMLHVKKGRPPRGVRRLERDAPEFIPALVKTVPTHDACSCADALRAEIELYRELRQPYLNSLVKRDKAVQIRSIEYLDQIAGVLLSGGK